MGLILLMGANRSRSSFLEKTGTCCSVAELRVMEWMAEKEVQQTPLVGIKERFSSLKENSAYLEATKNGAMLCIKNEVIKWASLKEGSLRIFR